MTEKFICMITEESILQKIDSLALELDQKYQGQEVTLVMVLKGSICFTSDLLRRLQTPVILETVQCKSYGQNGSLRGDLTIFGADSLNIGGKHVLVIDDIFDSGVTLRHVLESLERKSPKSLTSAVLLSKQIPRESSVQPDYILFNIENEFVVGYGLDYKEHYRGLRGIYTSKGGFS